MRAKIEQFWSWSHSHEGRKIIRFTAVSGISTVVSFVTITVVYGFKIIAGVVWATIFGNVVATFPAYQLNRKWTWGKTGRSHVRKEIIPFWLMSALGITFSILGATFARHIIHSHQFPHIVNTGIVAFANLVSFGVFWVAKLKVFNHIFQVDELEEVEEHLVAEEQGATAISESGVEGG
jgi:putative flippase GtrA